MAEKKLIIDVKGALLAYERKTGKKKTMSEHSKHFNVTTTTFQNWDKEAPAAVKFIFNFMKETGCTFEELVKEV